MSEAKHKFNIKGGSKDSASKNDSSFSKTIQAAVTNGGDKVSNWFAASQAALTSINRSVSNGGDTVWISGTSTDTGNPVQYVVDGTSILELGAYYTDDGKQKLSSGTLSLEDFQEIGFAYMLLVLNNGQDDQTLHQISTFTLEYAGEGIADIEEEEGFKAFIEQTVKTVKTFFEEMIKMSLESEGEIGADAVQQKVNDNASDAADSSKVEGETIQLENQEVVADIGLSAAEAVGLIFGLGELALTFTLTLLEKKIVNYVRIYNLSDIPFELSVCYVQEGSELASGPMLPQDPMNLPALSPSWTPASILGNNAAHFIDLIFCNTDDMKGVGYVLKAASYNDFPGFNVLVNIPSNSDNSFHMSFGEQDVCSSYWEANNNGQKSLTMNTTSGAYTLKIATNQLNGQTSSPSDGEEGYYYEHLIVFEKA